MKIAVLIKQVPVSNDVSIDPVTHALVRASSEGMINPADLNAIEMAMCLKEQTEGNVVVFTMGPPEAEKALREAMALGCDESCLITDRAVAGGDTIATAKVLARAIENYGEFDLILCGGLSADGATGQVGAMVAEALKIPHVSEIQHAEYEKENPDTIVAVKKMYDVDVRVRAYLPGLLSVNFGCNEPRLATLRTMRAAKKKPLAKYTNEDLKFAPEEIGIAGSPTVTIDSFEPEKKSSAQMIKGTPEELAKKLKEMIKEEKGKA